MRNSLFVAAAVTVVIGSTTFALAQNATMGGPQPGAGMEQGAKPELKGTPSAVPGNTRTGTQTTPGAVGPVGQNQGTQVPGQVQSQMQNPGTMQRGPEPGEVGKSGTNTGTSTGTNSAQQQAKPSGNMSAQLSQEQRTKIKGMLGRSRMAKVAHPRFSVTVGTRIPRNVHVTVLPSDIVTIVPQYRGFDYVMVGDEILIVDPRTLEIVAILPA